jgi:hypothetical protein
MSEMEPGDVFDQDVVDAQGTTPSRRARVADGLGRAASRLHDRAEHTDGKTARLADSAGNALDSAERFVREFDPAEVVDAVGDYARRNPGKVLLGAVVVGFLAARTWQRRDS